MISLISPSTRQAINFQVYQPEARLLPWVQTIWSMNREQHVVASREKLYPDGGASLTITFVDALPRITLEFNKSTFIRDLSDCSPSLSVRFRPAALSSLLSLDVFALADQPLLLGMDIVPCWYSDLRRVVDVMSVDEMELNAEKLQAWLLTLQQSQQATSNNGLRLLYTVQESDLPVNDIGKSLGMTRRTLERRLKKETGFSPQEIVTAGRIHQARKLLCNSQQRVTDIAVECGYFDQAHFCHAFKAFTLETPSRYRKRKLSQIYNS